MVEAGARRALLPCPELALLQVYRRSPSAIAAFQVEAYLLPFVEIADAGALDRRDMNEHILRTVIGLDEAETLCGVEPFHRSNSHRSFLKHIAPARERAEGQTSARCGEQVRRSIRS